MTDEQILFKTIFEQTPVSTQIFTPDGETLMVNKAWEDLWRIKFKQIKNYNILKDKQLVERGVMPLIKRAFKGEAVSLPVIKYVPSKIVKVKGAAPYRWLGAKMYPIRDTNGKVTHIVLQHEDISQRIQAEEMKYQLAAIVESSVDAIIGTTLDGTITSWNKGAESLYGYKEKEAVKKHITLIIPPELRKEEEKLIRLLRKGRYIDHYETVRVAKSGKRIQVSLTISPIRNAQGVITGISKIARDITQQKKSEIALKESEERLRLALEAGKIGVWDWNIPQDILTWTENVYTSHGVSPKNFPLTFANYIKMVHPDDTDRVKKAIKESLNGNVPYKIEFRIIRPDGNIRWVSTSAIISRDKKGKAFRMLGATIDITERKQLDQEKSDFLSMASHELKTPLTSMKIFIDLLQANKDNYVTEKQKYYISRIRDQADRLNELTRDLLDVSRIETGKLKLNKETFRIDELVRDTVESIQPSTNNHEIFIQEHIPVTILADRYRIYQVLVNLLTNAIKYSGSGKKIIVSIQQKAKEVIVSVQDFGIGIKKSKQDKIFDRLYQVTDPEEKTYPGLGLGLYISKEIIDRHKGRIWVESEKNKGSTFSFSLPIEKNT